MEYLPIHLSRSGIGPSDPEHFFRIRVEITQRFYRVTLKETIEEIFDSSGKKIPNVEARKFSGQGMVVNGINLALIFDEIAGLTCGTMLLTMDTWGNQLSGAMIVRNVDGKPVVAEVILCREPGQSPDIESLVEWEKANPNAQLVTRSLSLEGHAE